MLRAGPDTGILAASYLELLARALSYPGRLRFFDMPAADILLSAFAVRQAGFAAIAASLWRLRNSM